MSKYNDFFENINPNTSDEELLAEVKGMVHIRHKYTRKIIAVFAVATIMMMSSVTILAYHFGIIDSVRSFFSDKKSIISGDINKINIISSENTFDALDISVSGAVRDNEFTVIFIDITRKDGEVFDTSDYLLTDKNGKEIIMSDGKNYLIQPSVYFSSDRSRSIDTNGGEFMETPRCYLVKDDNPTDNKITLAYCISAFNYDVLTKYRLNLENLIIKYHYGSVIGDYVYLHNENEEFLSGSFLCELDMSNISSISDVQTIFPNVMTTIPVLSSYSTKINTHDFKVLEISVSSITIKIKLECEKPQGSLEVQTYSVDGIGNIILKDGTVLPFGNDTLPQIVLEHTSNNSWYFNGSFVLPQTIQPEEISAIVIGNTEIPFEASGN